MKIGESKAGRIIKVLDEHGCFDYSVIDSTDFEFNSDYGWGVCYPTICKVIMDKCYDDEEVAKFDITLNKALKKVINDN
jgi:hypothetical protein